MATQPTLTLIDQLVTVLTAAWDAADPPRGANDTVSREYTTPVAVESLNGRKVYLFPIDYGGDPASRLEDWYMHGVAVLTVERYADAGPPPNDWVDERVDFVHDLLFSGLDYSHNGPLRWTDAQSVKRTVWTDQSGPVPVFDVGMLATKKLFWSEVEFVFREAL